MHRVTPLRSEIKVDQRVVFYPSFGYLDEDSRTWKITIRGAIYEPASDDVRKKMLVRLLRRAMKVSARDLESEIFRQRVSDFLVIHKRGKRVAIRVGPKTYALRRKSKRDGHFGGTLRLSVDEVRELEQAGHLEDGWLDFETVARGGDNRSFGGRSQLVGRTGISVISDIDDTIKHSNVSSRRTLLANTFLREFESIPGMARLFQSWAARGSVFHYVSSSPWQLYIPLAELCTDDGFPTGTYHLRTVRLRGPRVLTLLFPNRWGKRRTIRSILKAFPRRKFVLVGDSGERDPEIYGAAGRRHPQQVARILIRHLRGQTVDHQRFRRAFRRIHRDKWKLFDDSREIEDLLPDG